MEPGTKTISRRQFLKDVPRWVGGAAVAVTGLALAACNEADFPSSNPDHSVNPVPPTAPESPSPASALPEQQGRRIDQIENLSSQILVDWNTAEPSIPTDTPVIVIDRTQKFSQQQTLNPEELQAAAGALALPALAEPSPIGEAVVIAMLATATGAMILQKVNEGQNVPELSLIEPNSHTKERRGEQLAQLIVESVEAAFLNPDPNNDKNRYLCAIAQGIIDGCDAAMFLATEIVSPTSNLTRVVSVLFGHDVTTGEWRQISALYFRHAKNKSTSIDKYVERMTKRGFESFNVCPDNFPPPGQLFTP